MLSDEWRTYDRPQFALKGPPSYATERAEAAHCKGSEVAEGSPASSLHKNKEGETIEAGAGFDAGPFIFSRGLFHFPKFFFGNPEPPQGRADDWE